MTVTNTKEMVQPSEKTEPGLRAALSSWRAAFKGARQTRLERKEVAARQREDSREAQRLEKEARDQQRSDDRRQKREARQARLAERARLAGAAAQAALGWSASVWLETALWVCLGLSLAVAYSVSYSSLGIVLGAFGYGAWERWAAPLAIDLPLTASVVGQLLAARWGSPLHVKATLLLLSIATAPLTLAGNALHGAIDQSGSFTYDKNGVLAFGHVDAMHLVAFSIPGACVILVSLVASTMLTEREKLGRRALAGAVLEAGEHQSDAERDRLDLDQVSALPPTGDAQETRSEPGAASATAGQQAAKAPSLDVAVRDGVQHATPSPVGPPVMPARGPAVPQVAPQTPPASTGTTSAAANTIRALLAEKRDVLAEDGTERAALIRRVARRTRRSEKYVQRLARELARQPRDESGREVRKEKGLRVMA